LGVRFTYSEFDGENGAFLSPANLFPQKGIADFLIEFGQQGLDALDEHPDAQLQRVIEEMIAAGLLERDSSGNLRLTPRMHRGIQHRAFLEVFRNLRAGVRDGHASPEPGARGERADGTRAFQFGDPVSEIDAHHSMRNAMHRIVRDGGSTEKLTPIRFHERDFEIFHTEATTDSALAILIDLSGSMMRYGRHIAAKQIALGMASLVREKFPLDTVDFIGFASTATVLAERDLPLIMPRPITTHEWNIRIRCPLSQADQTHPHFTNLHHALRLGRERLRRRGAQNKQMFVITDGQPTAHLSAMGKGAVVGLSTADPSSVMLNLIYPPSEQSAEATLHEALRCHQEGIRISSFAMIEEYDTMEWVGFVDQMTRLVKGVAFYCAAGDLGSTIMESYLAGRRTKKALGT
jgi:uncharacterized protein with von Willebrand factor type A (vWA) domain